MTTMISEVYDTFMSAGVDEWHSRKAAEAVAQADTKFAAVDPKLASISGELVLQRWMLVVVLAFLFAIVVKLFVH